ncbi:unnamed protein product [Miscanthus lutarioriparius]|uniref:Uncharacterized protein n=1 Tax=Miscanthus lutarioriparius TaxID=422564 RepID=A0A811QXA5_9POAL|nr:unnamed protein product [Miscanthus lutarioriparius]
MDPRSKKMTNPGKHSRKQEICGKYLLISWGDPRTRNVPYSARDFMYYMKRCGNDTALLQCIDYKEDALAMIEDCIQEKKIRIAVPDTQLDQEGEYAITPIKQRSTHEEVSGQGIQDEDIDAYKVWLNKLPQDENNPDAYLDDETIEEDGSGDNSAKHQCDFSSCSESAFSKVTERIELEASVISKEQERHILHETYKETTGCRSRKGPGHGYMAKYPTQSQLMNERNEEQARASALAAASSPTKNIEMQNAAPTTTAPQPTETTTHPSEFTTNATGIENMVSGNEGADLAQAGTESALGIHNAPSNGPAVVPTPSQGPEQVQKILRIAKW